MKFFGDTSCLVIFLGNPRSGTTLIRSILDAHPDIVISNEVNILRLLLKGYDWDSVVNNVILNARDFRRNPIWNDYNYIIDYHISDKREANPKIIGDKKAGQTTQTILDNPQIIQELIAWAPIPVKVIHCYRDPLDVIATKVINNKKDILWNIFKYFEYEQCVLKTVSLIGHENYHAVCHEEFIEQPTRKISALLNFLSITESKDYSEACKKVVSKRPIKSRHKIIYSDKELKSIRTSSLLFDHLKNY